MVASYSPHRHQGETATLFSAPHTTSPSRHHMLRSPTSCSSPFAIPIPSSVKTRSSTRRLTPLKSRGSSTAPVSPVKFPLSLTTTSHMNSSGMTLRSGSSSPRASPREKIALQRQARAGLGMENGAQSPPSTGSPLKRSDGIMNLDQASRGSPVAKRRSQFGLYSSGHKQQHTFGSPSFGQSPTPVHHNTTPKRHNTIKKSAGHGFSIEKPSFARSRPQARQHDFVTPSDPASKIRRVTSVDNFHSLRRGSLSNGSSLPSASIHPHHGAGTALQSTSHHPHPLSQNTFSSQSPGLELEKDSSEGSNEWRTPQNFRFARPNPAAFHSTGFVPKRGRLMHADKDHGPQPDTPCKKPNNAFGSSAFQSGMGGGRVSMTDFANTSTPFGNNGGGVKLGFGTLDRKASTLSTDDESDLGQSQSSTDYDLPPTPTKKVYSNIGGIFNSAKRARTEQSSDDLRVRYSQRFEPQTPKDNIQPPDPSSLSISGRANHAHRMSLPATPARDFFSTHFDFSSTTKPRPPRTVQSLDGRSVEVTDSFLSRFSEIKHIGSGEFSEVYQVTEGRPRRNAFIASLNPSTPHQLATPKHSSPFGSSPVGNSEPLLKTYAVKKSKSRCFGAREKGRRQEEVQILKSLGRSEHVLEFVDSWDEDGYLYIQTEFCDNGSLDKFLEQHGNKGRLDEFRVWKVLLELCLGLQHIHDLGFIHLDLKPANVLITFDGALKISDFGMATRWPASRELEREGDREYIAPEVLESHRYDKPVDIFALGLTMIEAAGNEALPPNGPEWQSLRSGDLSVAPILSTSSSGELVVRDEDGNPISTVVLSSPSSSSLDSQISDSSQPRHISRRALRTRTDPALLHKPRAGDLVNPPDFMLEGGLEELVTWMISANPDHRPTVSQLLETDSVRWVESRRRSPATVFEGLWGPDVSPARIAEEEDDVMVWEKPEDSSPWG
ncbi:hypothetical protein B9Z19DRAFT_1068688 [Tuber borchii]|uniref:Protein kinase domain-containing protein n=1 Tax=Tuber borchii TaxID=42251 RepID=A0A2T6ZEA7_TUBBO|nr:hypothetical protein B9Z19DRAFT_1068688 [Tuber borchii]